MIRKLPAEVRSQLRSGIVITNVAQCVVELVLNALDAGATSVAVRINFDYFKIQVIDNGCGLNSEQLDLIGERYMTSKCHSISDLCNNLNQFGFRGEALASIREVSGMLMLESRPRDSDLTYCKAFTHGKGHQADVSSTKRADHGTTVSIHDFMYNMPVRRQRIKCAVDLEEIKSGIESIALMQPQTSFSLRNDTNGNLILHTKKCSDTLTAFSHIFGESIASTLVPVGSALSEFMISGYVSKEPHSQKKIQFVYVNKRLVLKTKFHKLVNTMLANSFILRTTATDIPISKDASTAKWLVFSTPSRRDRHAVYVLNIECPFHAYDICFDPKKTLIEFCDWDTVLQCMESTIRTFLEKEFSSDQESQGSSIDTPQQDAGVSKVKPCLKESTIEEQHCTIQKKVNKYKGNPKVSFLASIDRKILDAPRIIKGNPARRKEGTICDYAEEQGPRETSLDNQGSFEQPEIATAIESGRKTKPQNLLNFELQEHVPENSHTCSELYNLSRESASLQSKAKDNLPLIKLKRKINVNDSSSEAPISESDCAASCKSTQRHLLQNASPDDSGQCPIVRFRKLVGDHKLESYGPSQNKYIAPVVKFRKKFKHLSDVNSTVGLHNLEVNISQVQKKSVRISNIGNEGRGILQTEDVTVNGYMKPHLKNCKSTRCSEKVISSNLKGLFQNMASKYGKIDKRKKAVHSKRMESIPHIISKDKTFKKLVDGSEVSENIVSLTSQPRFRTEDSKEFSERASNVTSIRRENKDIMHTFQEQKLDFPEHAKVIGKNSMKDNSLRRFYSSYDFLHTLQRERRLASRNNSSNVKQGLSYIKEGALSRELEGTERGSRDGNYTQTGVNSRDNTLTKQGFDYDFSSGLSDYLMQNANSKVQDLDYSTKFKFSPKIVEREDSNFNYLFGDSDFQNHVHNKYSNEKQNCIQSEIELSNSTSFGQATVYKEHIEGRYQWAHGHSMDFTSGSEADIEPSNNSEECIKRSTEVDNSRNCSSESIKRKLHTMNSFSYIAAKRKNAENNYFHKIQQKAVERDGSNSSEVYTPALASGGENNSVADSINASVDRIQLSSDSPSLDRAGSSVMVIGESSPDLHSENSSSRSIISDSVHNSHVRRLVTLHKHSICSGDKKVVEPEKTHVIINTEQSSRGENNDFPVSFHNDPELRRRISKLHDTGTTEYPTSLNDDYKSCTPGTTPSDCINLLRSVHLSSQIVNQNKTLPDECNRLQHTEEVCYNTLSSLFLDERASGNDRSETDKNCPDRNGDSRLNQDLNDNKTSRVVECTVKKRIPPEKDFPLSSNCTSPVTINLISGENINSTANAGKEQDCLFLLRNALENAGRLDSGGGKETENINECTNNCDMSSHLPSDSQNLNNSCKNKITSPTNQNNYTKTLRDTNVDNLPINVGREKEQRTDNVLHCKESILETVNVSKPSEVFETAVSSKVFAKQVLNSQKENDEKRSEFSNRKRKSETDWISLYGKNAYVDQPPTIITSNNASPSSANIKLSQSESCSSKSIATQELNKAFDNAMDYILGRDHSDSRTNQINTFDGTNCEKEKDSAFSKNNKEQESSGHLDGWEKRFDANGEPFFVHKQSGITSYMAPNHSSVETLFSMTKRSEFLPKGLSQILKVGNAKHGETTEELTPGSSEMLKNIVIDISAGVDELATVKWKDGKDSNDTGCKDLVMQMLEESDNRMQFCEKEVASACVQELPRSTVKVYNVIYPYTFNKDIFSNLRVLGQLDNKFIVTIVGLTTKYKPDLIVLFDQHAVHERIRLESLSKEYIIEGSDSVFRSSVIDPHIMLSLNKEDIRVISAFRKDFERLGLQFEIVDDSGLKVMSVPTCLLARELRETQGRGVSVIKGFLESIIREQVDTLLTTRGAGIQKPAVLHSVMCSEACRGAVKFGDPLQLDECEILLKQLSGCQVPFQCAHGRPALVPIVDLKHLQLQQTQTRNKLQLSKLKSRLGKT